MVVAADGAARRLASAGLRPDAIIGDLDSFDDRHSAATRGSLLVEELDQNRNDFEKALDWLITQGVDDVTIVGCTGGMPDHALNNFSVLARYAGRLHIRLRERDCVGYCSSRHIRIDAHEGERISLIPLPSSRLVTTGLVWNLHDELLEMGVREGASNRAAHDGQVDVEVRAGVVVVFHYPTPP